jgi:hypothetical protein
LLIARAKQSIIDLPLEGMILRFLANGAPCPKAPSGCSSP